MKSITFGRSSENDYVVSDSNASRKHCQIIQDDNGSFRLIDLNSQNGTYVNGVKRHGEVSLHETDIVKIGNTTVTWLPYFTSGKLPQQTLKNGNLGVASFVCGVAGISLLTIAFGIIAYPFVYAIVGTSVLAIVFGIMGWAHDRKYRGLAIAGFILGCVWALVCIIWIIVVATTVSNASTIVPEIPSYF